MSTYLNAPALRMQLSGRWTTGGILEICAENDPVACINLSPAAWTVLAKLFLQAIHSQSVHWFSAYVTTKELTQILEQEGVLKFALPGRVHKLVNKIRSELAKTAIGKLVLDKKRTEKERAASVIQSLKGPGYRIALPPSSLQLFIGKTQYKP